MSEARPCDSPRISRARLTAKTTETSSATVHEHCDQPHANATHGGRTPEVAGLSDMDMSAHQAGSCSAASFSGAGQPSSSTSNGERPSTCSAAAIAAAIVQPVTLHPTSSTRPRGCKADAA